MSGPWRGISATWVGSGCREPFAGNQLTQKIRRQNGSSGGFVKRRKKRQECLDHHSMLAAKLLEAGQSFIEDIQRGAVAEADAVVVAEGDTGDGGDLVAREQFVAEVDRLQAGVAGVNEEIERAFRFNHADVRDSLETREHELAFHVVFATEVFDERLVSR